MEASGKPLKELAVKVQRIGIAADHGGFELKEFLAVKLRAAGYEVIDFDDGRPKEDDDYGRLMDGKLVPPVTPPEHNLTPQIAKRAYQLYEQRDRQSGHSDQDWLQAEREINLEPIS